MLVIQPERLHVIVEGESLVEAVKVKQRDDLVVEGLRRVRSKVESLVVPCQRLFIPAKQPQRWRRYCCSSLHCRDRAGQPGWPSARASSNLFRLWSVHARACSVGAWFGSTSSAKIKLGNRLLVPTELVEESPAFVQRVLMAGIELEHVLKNQQRLIKARQLHENVAQLSP